MEPVEEKVLHKEYEVSLYENFKQRRKTIKI